jgi:hypothetical protein
MVGYVDGLPQKQVRYILESFTEFAGQVREGLLTVFHIKLCGQLKSQW